MPATYEPIASVTLAADASSLTFGSSNSLPQTYTDLILVCQQFQSVGGYPVSVRANGDSGSNYSFTHLKGNGTTASSNRYSSQTLWQFDFESSSSTTAYTISIIQFMSYSNSNVFKTALSSAGRAGGGVDRSVGLWRSTAAITQLDVLLASGNFKSGSTFSLFGIRGAA
jgi:FlaG/FlaF family flagellin (archaellin)